MAFLPVLTFLLLFDTYLGSKYEFFTHSPNATQRHDINDCAGLQNMYPESTSGLYTISPSDKKGPMMVFCDMTTDGGGWTVIQRRSDGSVNFTRPWSDYQQGFGNQNNEFWLGNDNIHRLTSCGNVELKIDLTSLHGKSHSVHYQSFSVGDVNSLYELRTEGFSGDIGDALLQQNCMKFSAIDFDPFSCAANRHHGGWWYNDCQTANLNGEYNINSLARIKWKPGSVLRMTKTEMRIRPNKKYMSTVQCHHAKAWEDCEELRMSRSSAPSGVYTLDPKDGKGPFKAYCDMGIHNGGWTVIQRRVDGSVNFTRTFKEYKVGFGDLANEFYLGNEIIHRITAHKWHKLLFILEDFNGITKFEVYNNFYVSKEIDFYRLTVGDANGTAGDSFTYNSGQQFSTFDSDHDGRDWSCAERYKGGWWYKSCEISNLNGVYNSAKPFEGVVWKTFNGTSTSLKSTTMLIKPMVQCTDCFN